MGQLFTSHTPTTTEVITFPELADDIRPASHVVALTGAGVSAESGIPTFRDPLDGLWQRYNPSTYATIWGFWMYPKNLWELIRDFLKENDPQPNAGHFALAELESLGYLKAIVTQNVDNLHQDAGSKNVIEYHGNLLTASCYSCREPFALGKDMLRHPSFTENIPPKCHLCGGIVKPNVVLFGERIPLEARNQAAAAVDRADLLLVVGTSASVAPASDLPRRAKAHGARVIEVNPQRTGLTNRVSDKIVYGKSSELAETVKCLKQKAALRI